jgi:hypothetical protein
MKADQAIRGNHRRLLAVLACMALTAPAAAAEPPKKAEADPLLELNKKFQAAYARARKETLAKSGPVLLVEGDSVVLLRNGKRSEAAVVPVLYHTLKAVSHVPLAVYVLLAGAGDAELGVKRLADLRAYRDQVAKAAKHLGGRGLSEEQSKRATRLLARSRRFLDRVLAEKKVKADDLTAFARKAGPLLRDCAADAAHSQLDALDRQVQAWKGQMTEAEWKKLRVVVMGSAMPRKGNINVQYFAKRLGGTGEGPRIVYAESLWDEEKALNLLGTHLLDTAIGAAFFNDPERMHRDLLADAAAAYLKKMTVKP